MVKCMHPLIKIPFTVTGSGAAALSTIPWQQSVAKPPVSILPTPPMLVPPEAALAGESLTERFARIVVGESPSLDISGEGIEHDRILGDAAGILRKFNRHNIHTNVPMCMSSELSSALNPELDLLVNSLKGLNPHEQTAICTAKFSGKCTFPMLVAKYTPMAIGALLDTIEGLSKDAQAEILTAQDDVNCTFSILVIRRASENAKKLLSIIRGLGRDTQAGIFTVQDNAKCTLPMLIVQNAPNAIEALLEAIESFGQDVQAEIFTAQDDVKCALPIYAAQRAAKSAEALLNAIRGLSKDAQAKVFTAQNGVKCTFPMMFVVRQASKNAGTLLDMIMDQDADVKAEILTVQDIGKWTLPAFVARHLPEIIEKILDMVESLRDHNEGKTPAKIFAQSYFLVNVVQYAQISTIERLLKMMKDLLDAETLRAVTSEGTFLMHLARRAPKILLPGPPLKSAREV
jgi:hypothetical protein